MRINCAHDDAATWERMIAHLRRAEEALGRPCGVFMDLGGPKLRTGPVEPACGVIKYRPERNPLGQVTAPARIWLTDREHPLPAPTAADACLPLPDEAWRCLEAGDRICFRDARGSRREMEIVDRSSAGCWAEAFQTAYVTADTVLKFRRRGRKFHGPVQLGKLPDREQALRLHVGDTLVLTRSLVPGRPATYDSQGRLLSPACIGCTLPEVFEDVQPGEHIWLDDGKIGGILRTVDKDQMRVQITQASAAGDNLRGDKGINLPDSNLRLAALTEKDRADLPFIVEHADAVSYSFVRRAEHVEELQARLAEIQGERLGIILKIETREAFDQLPSLLLASMKTPRVGVMIARGDLAVECGYERLAEVQEEILWMCEAAHIPVIWATQVLESLAKAGKPSRAEISDAAAAGRAECVMLNKGPHIIKAVQVLDDILQRMQAHQSKKRSMLRPLNVAKGFEG
jgi:pyruvate kinase